MLKIAASSIFLSAGDAPRGAHPGYPMAVKANGRPLADLSDEARALAEQDVSLRDAAILEARVQGRSLGEIAREYGLSRSGVHYIEQQHLDWIEERRIQARMQILARFREVIANQLDIASDPNHPRSPDAFRELSRIVYPRRGPHIEINQSIGPGSVAKDARVQTAIQEIRDLSDEELKARIREAEAKYERPPPPGHEEPSE